LKSNLFIHVTLESANHKSVNFDSKKGSKIDSFHLFFRVLKSTVNVLVIRELLLYFVYYED
jgi:hypothetical protein